MRGSAGAALGPAAFRFFAAGAAAFMAMDSLCAAAEPVRAAPQRPGAGSAPPKATSVPPAVVATVPPVAARKMGGVEYVALPDVASRLGMKLTWVERGKKATLTGGNMRAELAGDTRDIVVNGLRVFLGDPTMTNGGQLFVSRVDFERCLTPLLRPGFGVAPISVPKTIVLDPGHGGKDTGTSALEKVYTLDVAKRVKVLLEANGYRVVLTRDTDVFLDLTRRSAVATVSRADLFASIHFNALPKDTKTSGVEVFTFAPAHQRSTSAWSPRERDDTEKEPAPVNRFDHWSVIFAQAIQRRFVQDLKAFDRGRKIAHWGVLRGLQCPGVLIECGFLTSDLEAKKIATPEYRQKLAEAIAAGIRDYAAVVADSRAKAAPVARTPSSSSATAR